MCLEPAFKGQNKKKLKTKHYVDLSISETPRPSASLESLASGFWPHYSSYFALSKDKGKFPWVGP